MNVHGGQTFSCSGKTGPVAMALIGSHKAAFARLFAKLLVYTSLFSFSLQFSVFQFVSLSVFSFQFSAFSTYP